MLFFFFFNDTATTEIYTLSLHDALPICRVHSDAAPVVFHASGFEVEVIDVHLAPNSHEEMRACDVPLGGLDRDAAFGEIGRAHV